MTLLAHVLAAVVHQEPEPAPESAAQRSPVVLTEEALRIHRSALVFDGHNDVPWVVRSRGDSSFDRLDLAQPDHVGLGSDYDGVTKLPKQLEDVSCYPFITQELLNRGWSEADVKKVLGGNALRALRGAEAAAGAGDSGR